MLKPSMQDLMKRVNNRYLLVNLAAQRARDLSAEEETSDKYDDSPLKLRVLSFPIFTSFGFPSLRTISILFSSESSTFTYCPKVSEFGLISTATS